MPSGSSEAPTPSPAPVAARVRKTAGARRPIQSLFARLFIINGTVFTIGTLVLAFSPVTVSAPAVLTEIPVLIIGLVLILAINATLVRASLAPLDSLTALMRRADLLRTRDRVAHSGNGDLGDLVTTFNEMLDRLEAEHSASSAHALAAQEGERQRIARELHDEIGQSLTVALLALKRVVDKTPEPLQDEVRLAQQAVRTSLDDVRQVAQRLRPGVLADLGLRSALDSLGAEFARSSGITVVRDIADDLPDLGSNIDLVIYRVAQEGLTNVARHAGATQVELRLTRDADTIELRITDDGRGGPIEEGAGVRGMRERAALIRAHLQIGPSPAGGTQVLLVIPLEAEGAR